MVSRALKRILLVEDEPLLQAVARQVLEALGGFTVEACFSGREALEKAPAFSPDLILLDVMMPQMDGITTLKALREIPGTADTPVIFMTALADTEGIARFRELGAVDVIEKPFDPKALAETVSNIWNGIHG